MAQNARKEEISVKGCDGRNEGKNERKDEEDVWRVN